MTKEIKKTKLQRLQEQMQEANLEGSPLDYARMREALITNVVNNTLPEYAPARPRLNPEYPTTDELNSLHEEYEVKKKPQVNHVAKTVPVVHVGLVTDDGQILSFQLAFYGITKAEFWQTNIGSECISSALKRHKLEGYTAIKM